MKRPTRFILAFLWHTIGYWTISSKPRFVLLFSPFALWIARWSALLSLPSLGALAFWFAHLFFVSIS